MTSSQQADDEDDDDDEDENGHSESGVHGCVAAIRFTHCIHTYNTPSYYHSYNSQSLQRCRGELEAQGLTVPWTGGGGAEGVLSSKAGSRPAIWKRCTKYGIFGQYRTLPMVKIMQITFQRIRQVSSDPSVRA